MPKVINLRDTGGKVPEGAVLIDRRTGWGNPFKIGPDGTRAEVIELHKSLCNVQNERDMPWFPKWRTALDALRGKDLACWCAPLPCHGDVLLELANREE